MANYRSVISAITMAVAYQFAWPLGAFGLIPMFSGPLKKRHFFIWGIVYMGVLHLFFLQLADDTHVAVAIILYMLTSIYFGCFYGIGGLALRAIQLKTGVAWWWFTPITFPIFEWAKAIGPYGNPHGDFGFIPAAIAHHIPLYGVVGHPAIGMLIILLNVLIYLAFCQRTYAKHSAVIVLLILTTMGGVSSPNTPRHEQPIHVIQTGVDQHKKQTHSAWSSLEQAYLDQLSTLTNGIAIMPETILPTTISNRPLFDHLQHLSSHKKIDILFGTFIDNDFNGAVMMRPNNRRQTYKKQQLMPFGEVLPLGWLLRAIIPSEWLLNDFKRGPYPVIMTTDTIPIRPIICLEGIYARFYRMPPTGMVAILANNAWFNHSQAGAKLIQFARVHAAQHQVPVALSANYGESAIIDSTGRLMQHHNHHTNAILTDTIVSNQQASIHARWPWLGVCLITGLWALLMFRIRGRLDL
ncbi:MAG: apolipoprotein N-acyltransferase [Candidatus Margulisbacteria bacterium]|nr:apolipoprotein N-acyltransferase [Candidatus Margulisiibacteriota bacterium]